MKIETIKAAPGYWDLQRCLLYTSMPAGERSVIGRALREIRARAFAGSVEPSLEAAVALHSGADPDARARLGPDGDRLLRHLGRALRAWDEPARQALTLLSRTAVLTFEDAIVSAELVLAPDVARRIRRSVERACRAGGAEPCDMPATLAAIGPVLARATPETFGVATLKAMKNAVGHVRRALRLVGAAAPVSRRRDLDALSPEWAVALERVAALLSEHAHGARACLRRLALRAARSGLEPHEVGGEFAVAFIADELASHAASYRETVRAACAAWNEAGTSAGLPTLTPPPVRNTRLAPLAWESLPEGVRADFDAILAVMPTSVDTDWGAVVPDLDADDRALGLDQLGVASEAASGVSEGTVGVWRDAVKRGWQAATSNPAAPRPARLADLMTPAVFRDVVRIVRRARRDRLEGGGESFDPQSKGIREYNILRTLVSLARRLGLEEARLAPLIDLKDMVDPSILKIVRQADGRKQRTRRPQMGPHHATKVKALAEPAAMARWLGAPETIWRAAESGRRRLGPVRAQEVALARTALMAQIGQADLPLRRECLVTLRHKGTDPHIWLPVAEDREGRLHIPASETKTGVEVTVALCVETTRMLRAYIKYYLPTALKLAEANGTNPHLFPGAILKAKGRKYEKGDGFLSLCKANNTFRGHIWKYSAVDVNLHVMRHICAKIILDADPSAMALVQVLLGHTSIKTTQSYYGEVDQILAQRRYHELLGLQRRSSLGRIRFRIGPGRRLFRGGRTHG